MQKTTSFSLLHHILITITCFPAPFSQHTVQFSVLSVFLSFQTSLTSHPRCVAYPLTASFHALSHPFWISPIPSPANFDCRPTPLPEAQKASLYVDLSHSMPIPSPKSLPSSLHGIYSRTPHESASFAFSTFSISSKTFVPVQQSWHCTPCQILHSTAYQQSLPQPFL